MSKESVHTISMDASTTRHKIKGLGVLETVRT